MTGNGQPLSVIFLAVLGSVAACELPPAEPQDCGQETYRATVSAADIDAVDDGNGVLSRDECWTLCIASAEDGAAAGGPDSGLERDGCDVRPRAGDAYQVECDARRTCRSIGCGGRGHAAVATVLPPVANPTAAWLARTAQAEAASVLAFELLATELRPHGLPSTLQARLREAAEDERRHATAIGAFATARGVVLEPPVEVASSQRSLVDFAIENAVEGLVRETWAALEAHHQARFAAKDALRMAMARIAEDETRHAELARALHDWVMPRLTPDEQDAVELARARAIVELAEALRAGRDPELVVWAGLPGTEVALQMVDALVAAGVWVAQAA